MNDFTASNGVRVRVAPSENAHHSLEVMSMGLLRSSVDALREFFQAEDDERLGRWRWPENPGYLVYLLAENTVAVVEEWNGSSRTFSRAESSNSALGDAVRAYFDAHPEPKPWYDAALGDVWEFEIPVFFDPFAAVYQETARGKEWVVTRTGAPVDVSSATRARQVWPEVTDGD